MTLYLYLWQKPLNPDSATGQTCLSQAHNSGDRVECRCRVPAPPMYVAAIGGRFIVKRMPGTGPDHAVDCPSFLPPEELSGLAQIQATAIAENPDDGTTTLKIGFPLRKNSKSRIASDTTGRKPTEAKGAQRKLTITSVLHFLWQEADLSKWYPAMQGSRYWGVIHSVLYRVAVGKIVKGQDLSRILYVPEYFKVGDKAKIAARRNRFFANLRSGGHGATPLGLVIAEYKSLESTAHGARFTFKHAPDCAFFAEAELAQKFEKVFGDQLKLIEAIGSGHAVVIASFSIAAAGYPVLQKIGMMLVANNWIPFESLRELDVLKALTEQSRAFQKQMRFNLPADVPIASVVLLDTTDPVALFVADNPSDAGSLATITTAYDESRYASWCWFDDQPMAAFPKKGRTPSARDGQVTEEDITGQFVRPAPMKSRRASGGERDSSRNKPNSSRGTSGHV